MIKAGAREVITKEQAVDELYDAIQRAVNAVRPILVCEDGLTSPTIRSVHFVSNQ